MTDERRDGADRDARREAAEDGGPPEGARPLPPEFRKGPGGCGFTGCMYGVMVLFALALILLLIALFTRIWITTPMPRV